ncbi:MAG: transcription-repair coupling factor, partial [Pseudomonadota bacterium]
MTQSHITLSGAPEGFDASALKAELDSAGQVVHIARDAKRLVAMRDALAFFAPDVPVLEFPGWDCLPYDRVSPNSVISAARMATLAALAQGFGKGTILLTTLPAAMQRVPTRSVLQATTFRASVNSQVDESALRTFLVSMG